MLSEQIAT
jgi:hypothetical protein